MSETPSSRAFEVLNRAMERESPGDWQPGARLTREGTPEDKAALAALPLHLGNQDAWNTPLALRGRDSRSVWRFDQQADAYFAQLWRNGSSQDAPDIRVPGWGKIDGREFMTTTRLLAREIAAAAPVTDSGWLNWPMAAVLGTGRW